ncbi:hypothetical protein ACS0TY_021721 [Phlomoides rotata]
MRMKIGFKTSTKKEILMLVKKADNQYYYNFFMLLTTRDESGEFVEYYLDNEDEDWLQDFNKERNTLTAGKIMRPILCVNLAFDAHQFEIECLFKRYGRVDRVDMKSGLTFVYMEDERDAEDVIQKLNRIDFGRKGCRLRDEWTKQECGGRRPDSSRKSSANSKPSKNFFYQINMETQPNFHNCRHKGIISRQNFKLHRLVGIKLSFPFGISKIKNVNAINSGNQVIARLFKCSLNELKNDENRSTNNLPKEGSINT